MGTKGRSDGEVLKLNSHISPLTLPSADLLVSPVIP